MERVPEHVIKLLAQRQAEDNARRAMFGEVRLPVTFRSHGHRIVGIYDEVRWFPESWPFHQFLDDHARRLLGHDWGAQQFALPEPQRHPLLGWFAARSRLSASAVTREADGNFCAQATAAMACWLRLGWDFFTTSDADLLTNDILRRLRSRDHFHGARHELAVVALFNRCGYEIKHIKAGKTGTKTLNSSRRTPRASGSRWRRKRGSAAASSDQKSGRNRTPGR